MTKLFKPINAYLALHGIRHSIFIDDGRILAKDEKESEEHFKLCLSVLQKAGWQIEKKKSDKVGEGSMKKDYLGFLINTAEMTVSLTRGKKERLLADLNDLVKSRGRHLPLKHLAAVLGRVVAYECGIGPSSLILLRRSYHLLESLVSRSGWQANVRITDEVAQDMTTLIGKVSAAEGYPIRTKSRELAVVSLIGPPSDFMKTKVIPQHVQNRQSEIWSGDASAIAVCAYSCTDPDRFYFISKLSASEQSLSSGHRELLTAKKALENRLEKVGPWKESITLYWLTDSENLVSFLTKGSRKPEIQKVILSVLETAQQLGAELVPIHLRREDPRIQVADAGSKAPDSDDWSIDAAHFALLESQFGPFTIDLFADEANHRVKRFYSDFLCPTSSGIDAFCHSWDNEVAWICPPVKKVIHVTKKIRQTHGEGVLVVPKWPTSSFWTFLFNEEGLPRAPFRDTYEFKPEIIQNQRARSPLSGVTEFSFVALYFDTRQ